MEDIDEKILDSIEWSYDKYVLLDNISREVRNLKYRLEQLNRIYSLIEKDTYAQRFLYALPDSILSLVGEYGLYDRELEAITKEALKQMGDLVRNNVIKLECLPIYSNVVYDPSLFHQHVNFSPAKYIYKYTHYTLLDDVHNNITETEIEQNISAIPEIYHEKFVDNKYVIFIHVLIFEIPDEEIRHSAIRNLTRVGWIVQNFDGFNFTLTHSRHPRLCISNFITTRSI